MPLNDHGFAVVVLPRTPPPAPREEAGARYRMTWTADDDWFFERMPPRASTDYAPLLRSIVYDFGLGTAHDWTIRVQSATTLPGDGADLMVLACVGEGGAELRLSRDRLDVWRGELAPGQALLFDNRRLTHAVESTVDGDLLLAALVHD